MDEAIVKVTKEKVYEALKAPFSAKDIQWRVGKKTKDGNKGIVLAYVDARAIQERLDEVFDTWSPKYSPIDMGEIEVSERGTTKTKHVKGFLCTITGVKDGVIFTREDGGDCTDFEPFKGGLSSAFKRAGACLGIGRYLYDLGETWVDLDKYDKFELPQLPDWALPKEERGKGKDKAKTKANSTTSVSKLAVDMSEHKCSECGENVTEPVAKFSLKKFNKVVCYKCQKKEVA